MNDLKKILKEKIPHFCIIYISKIQLVVYYQCYILFGWAATRLYVIAPSSKKRGLFGGKKGLKSSFN